MKKLNPFFVIGTIGMLLTAVLHIVFALVLKLSATAGFLSVYPVFMAFLLIGFAQLIKLRGGASSR